MNAIISNIVLDKDRFRVFVSFDNGIEEVNVFQPGVVANDILAWVQSRVEYYQDLIDKEQQLLAELKEKEYNLEIFNTLYDTDPDFRKKVDETKISLNIE